VFARPNQPVTVSCAARRYRTAIRTATPLATCSRITEYGPSATSESISTPPFLFDPGASPPDPPHARSRGPRGPAPLACAHSLRSFASSVGHRFLAGQKVQARHPHGDAVGDLLENHRVRAVGHVRVDLDAAVHL